MVIVIFEIGLQKCKQKQKSQQNGTTSKLKVFTQQKNKIKKQGREENFC